MEAFLFDQPANCPKIFPFRSPIDQGSPYKAFAELLCWLNILNIDDDYFEVLGLGGLPICGEALFAGVLISHENQADCRAQHAHQQIA